MPELEREFTDEEFKYLNLLAKQYPNITSASTEIINLQAILNLPKGTEHFISDIHGEYEAFSHVLRNASGVIKNHITYILGASLRESEKKTLATLIYYPEQKLEEIKKTEKDLDDLVQNNPAPGLSRFARSFREIYALKGQKGPAAGFRLHNRGASPRGQRRRG